jgi:hypothetical protein
MVLIEILAMPLSPPQVQVAQPGSTPESDEGLERHLWQFFFPTRGKSLQLYHNVGMLMEWERGAAHSGSIDP